MRPLRVGDRVAKIDGDYTFEGTVVAVFVKTTGAERIVVEMDKYGVLFIAKAASYRLVP